MKVSAKIPQRKFPGTKLVVPVLCVLIAVAGAFVVGGQLSPVFSEVQSRKHPIYCGSTENAQGALSFDAAWGNV
ncbi:MAG: hypothetical protein LUD73_02645 [Lachnospiraceae bacterium]|nr:hypothetical protein [Lachnospiraceae bacterium]